MVMKNLKIFLIICVSQFLYVSQAFAQQIYLDGLYNGSVAWADYNNDGFQDLLVTGTDEHDDSYSRIYKNSKGETFIEQSQIKLPGASNASSAWADYDKDGFMDIVISGGQNGAGYTSVLYKNNGDGSFTEQSQIDLMDIANGSVAWADYNNDGFPDLLISGYTGPTPFSVFTRVYKNNGNGSFTEQTQISIDGVINGSIAWGDYNNDNYLDILVTGKIGVFANDTVISKIYKNNGDETFTEQTQINLQAVGSSSVAWADYNQDGYLDILLTGNDGTAPVTKIYKNNGNETFTEQTQIVLQAVQKSSVAWGDYNNDDFPDILLTGSDATGSRASKIYINNGDETFAEQTQINLSGADSSSVAWCDYNNDNFLDFIISGKSAKGPLVKIYKNNGEGKFFDAISPQNAFFTLNELVNISNGNVAWADYNQDGLKDILLTGVSLSGIPIAEIYKNIGNGIFNEQAQIQLVGVRNGSVAWGDYNNDTYPDILLTGSNNSGVSVSKIYKNTANGDFTEQTNITLTGVTSSSVAWGDYNNDNYLDILLTGDNGTNPVSKIYKNNGDGTFTEQTSIALDGVNNGCASWVDYDNDGFLDVYLSGGSNDLDIVSSLYKNNGNGTFTKQSQTGLYGYLDSDVRWGDYDNDNYLDVLVCGATVSLAGGAPSHNVTKVYKNNGDGTFTEQTQILLSQIKSGSVAWGDYNKDNFQDILMAGVDKNDLKVTKIYKSNGNGNFEEQTQFDLTAIDLASVAWCDINNNGYLDFLIAGSDVNDKPFSAIYMNDQSGGFNKLNYDLTNVGNSTQTFADFNKNSRLDVVMAGSTIDTTNTADTTDISTLFSTFDYGLKGINNAFTGVENGSVACPDYNNDGFADIILSGKNTLGTPVAKLYKNGANGSFSETGVFIRGLSESTIDWADYNNDGFADFLITGKDEAGNSLTKVYKNTKTGNFEETNIIFPAAYKALWVDFNNDQLYDIVLVDKDNTLKQYQNFKEKGFVLIAEKSFASYNFLDMNICDLNSDGWADVLLYIKKDEKSYLKYFINEGEGEISDGTYLLYRDFTDLNSSNYLSTADFDSDGDLDILINSRTESGDTLLCLYENLDKGKLSDPYTMQGTVSGHAIWGDWDNDNKPDILLSGKTTGGGLYSKLYINKSPKANTAPTAPSNLQFYCNADTVFISWDKAGDSETEQDGLTYNCYMYEIGGDTIWHSLSNQKTGKRYNTKAGNVGHNTSWSIQGLDVTKEYAWSVQAIDNGYTGGAFASESTFRLAPAFVIQPIDQTVCEKGSITFNTSTTTAQSYQWYRFSANDTLLIQNDEHYSNVTSPNLSVSNAALNMNGYELHCAATTVGGTTYSKAAILSVDTLILANAGDDGGVCVATDYQLSALDPSPASGTWSCDLQQVGFSDIHSPDATVTGLPEGNTSLLWTVYQDNVCAVNSDLMIITRKKTGSVPTSPGPPIGISEICKGSNLDFTTVAVANADAYNWNIEPPEAGTVSASTNTANINWDNNFQGTAQIKVNAENICGASTWSEPLQVNLTEKNAQDIVAKSDVLIFSPDEGYQYQWFLNGSAITGAQKQYYYNADMPQGDYQVEVTFHQNCKRLSGVFANGNLKKTLAESVSVYPNPATNTTKIEIDHDYTGKISFKMMDNQGKVYVNKIIYKNVKQLEFNESLSGLDPGVYVVEFIFKGGQKVSKQLIVK